MNEAALHIWLKSFKDRLHKKAEYLQADLSFVLDSGWVLAVTTAPGNFSAIEHSTFCASNIEDLITQGNKWVDEFEPGPKDALRIVSGLALSTTGGAGPSYASSYAASALQNTWGSGLNQAQQNLQQASLNQAYQNALNQPLQAKLQPNIPVTISIGTCSGAGMPVPTPKKSQQDVIQEAYERMKAETVKPKSWLAKALGK